MITFCIIRARQRKVKIQGLSASCGYVLEGVRAGALSYFLKDAEDDEILEAIRAASTQR